MPMMALRLKNALQSIKLFINILKNPACFRDGNFSLEVSSPGVDEPLKLISSIQKKYWQEGRSS